jgi:Holliday junction resolvase RusA-like endonuclease
MRSPGSGGTAEHRANRKSKSQSQANTTEREKAAQQIERHSFAQREHIDCTYPPFGIEDQPAPRPIVTVTDLPFPPSTNRMWARGGRGNVTLTKGYRVWKESADKFVHYTGLWRRAVKITGRFTAEIILDANERRRSGDLDNRVKAVLDWCQSRELIRNDRDCDDLHAYWGKAPHGCRVIIEAAAGVSSST